MLTVSPNKQYLGIFRPTTPATTGPATKNAYNMELNEKIICLRKSEVYVEKVYNVIEKLMEHGIHCLPFSYRNEIKDHSS